MKKFEELLNICHNLLHQPIGNDAKSYLDSRILPQTKEYVKFGYFPDSNNINLILSEFLFEDLEELKLSYKKTIDTNCGVKDIYSSYFENHPLIFPFRDHYGDIVAFIGRTLLSDEDRKKLGLAKYKNSMFEKSHYLFGLYEARKDILDQGLVYVVEGELDVLKAREKNINNIVSLGSSNMSFLQLSLLLRYTDNILLLLDNDEAGQSGRKKIIEKYSKYANFQAVSLPMGYKDIDEYLKSHDELSLDFWNL